MILSSGANVWQYSDNIIDFDEFQKIQEFVDSQSSKITYSPSPTMISSPPSRRARSPWSSAFKSARNSSQSGLAIPITSPPTIPTIEVLTRRPRNFPPIRTRGSGSPTSPIISPTFLAAAVLTRRRAVEPCGPVYRRPDAGNRHSRRLQPLERADQPRYYQDGDPAGRLFAFERRLRSTTIHVTSATA